MTYPEVIKYLESFVNYEKIPVWPYKQSFRLKRFRDFLATINNPQDALKCIHVAGSKGKGSALKYSYVVEAIGFILCHYRYISEERRRLPPIMRPTSQPRIIAPAP